MTTSTKNHALVHSEHKTKRTLEYTGIVIGNELVIFKENLCYLKDMQNGNK